MLNDYLKAVGVDTKLEFIDVLGFDEDLLAMVPQPAKAILLLYPISESNRRRTQNLSLTQVEQPQVHFIRQFIGNACGTIALLHCVATLSPDEIGNGLFSEILTGGQGISPVERGNLLVKMESLAVVHSTLSNQGQSDVPTDTACDLHYSAFVNVGGHLFELDGQEPHPIDHGESTDLLCDATSIIKKIMELDPSNFNFTVIALAPPQ